MANSNKIHSQPPPVFCAVLVPHRSMGSAGLRVVILALAAGWGIISLFFFAIGAWPVIGFFGLDLLLIYFAFKLNQRAAKAREEISLSRQQLDVRYFAPSGKFSEHWMNPLWTRFHIEQHAEIGITAMRLASQSQRLTIGSFLNPDDRKSFAETFSKALASVKK